MSLFSPLARLANEARLSFKRNLYSLSGDINRKLREREERLQAARRQRQLAEMVEMVYNPVVTTGLDLYQIYIARMRESGGTAFQLVRNAKSHYDTPDVSIFRPTWFVFDFIIDPNLEKHVFICFISILLGCDKAHDFTRNRFKASMERYYGGDTLINNLKELMDHFRDCSLDQVMEVCESAIKATYPTLTSSQLRTSRDTLLSHCVCLINLELAKTGCEGFYDKKTSKLPIEKYWVNVLAGMYSDNKYAQNTAFAISRILGISSVRYDSIVDSPTSLDIVKTLTPSSVLYPEWAEPIRVKIDATSASLNNVEDIMNIKNIDTRHHQVLVLDSASANDPAKSGTLQKIFDIFQRCSYNFNDQFVDAFVFIGNTPVNILTATLRSTNQMYGFGTAPTPANIPNIKLEVSSFLGENMTGHKINPKENELNAVINRIVDVWHSYPDGHILSQSSGKKFKKIVRRYSMEKTLGDFLQIITYAATPKPKVFITVDRICSIIAGILGSTSILDAGSTSTDVFRYLFVPTVYADARRIPFLSWCRAITTGGAGSSSDQMTTDFGKINNITKRLKLMSNSELKNKLKLVGIKITKTIRGKRKYLSRKELENKAILFNKLQNIAKRMKIKIMYKSKSRMYRYKTYKRLQKEINSKYNSNRKYKKTLVKNFNFG